MGSRTFSYTGALQTWPVPSGVSEITVTSLKGASSGDAEGGIVAGTFTVSASDVLYIGIGQKGLGGETSGTRRHGGAATFGNGGAGGDGYNHNAGDSGGGFSYIRMNSSAGTIIALAAGAGGSANSIGGDGGANTGQSGTWGNVNDPGNSLATGGSQTAAGVRAFSGSNNLNGTNGVDGIGFGTGFGGTGGSAPSGQDGAGGGGGGAGYHPGGGGNASWDGHVASSSGAGGSNYTGGLDVLTLNQRGGNGFSHGALTASWAPLTPTSLTPSGSTLSMSNATLQCNVVDPEAGDVKAVFQYTAISGAGSGFVSPLVESAYVASGTNASVAVTDLLPNTSYGLVAYAVDLAGNAGPTTSTFFTTNRTPNAPTLDWTGLRRLDSTTIQKLKWTFSDLDTGDAQSSANMRYRLLGATRTNLCFNPSIEASTSSWAAAGSPNPTISKSTDFHFSGTHSMKVVATGTASFFPDVNYTFPTVSGHWYSCSSYVYVPVGQPAVSSWIAGGAFGTTSSTTVGSFVRLQLTFQATSASHAWSLGQLSGVLNNFFYVDATLIEEVSDGTVVADTFFDGSFVGDPNYTYSWTGGVSASTSIKEPSWTTVSVTGATAQASVAANTFTSGNEYEWQAKTTDTGGLIGPYSESSTLIASPPVVNMGATAAVLITGSETHLPIVPMSGAAHLTANPSITKPGSVALSAKGVLTTSGTALSPIVTLTIAAAAGMQLNATHTIPTAMPMHAGAIMTVDGFRTSNGALTIQTSGGILFGEITGDTPMVARATLSLAPSGLTKPGSVSFSAKASVAIQPDHSINVSLPITASTAMLVGTLVTHLGAVGMAAKAAVTDSGGVSRIIPMVIATRAQLAVLPAVSHQASIPIAAQAGMMINGFDNVFDENVMVARGALSILGSNTTFDGVEVLVQAAMSIVATRLVTRAVPMGATAAMTAPQDQYVFDGPYLIDVDSLGDTISFTLNSYPIPRTISHTLTVSDNGSVTS